MSKFIHISLIWLFFLGLFLNPSSICSSPPKWMTEQIRKDLSPFEQGIKKETLDYAISRSAPEDGLVRYQITNGCVNVTNICEHPALISRATQIFETLKKLRKKYYIPNVDFIVCVHDFLMENNLTTPIFVFAKDAAQKNTIQMPDTDALHGYDHLANEIKNGKKRYPWKSKKQIAFWRGSTTGTIKNNKDQTFFFTGDFNIENWQKFPRTQLVLLSLQYPSILDAKFHNFCQGAENNQEMLTRPELKSSGVSVEDSLQYKYLVDVDGNSCSYSRSYWILRSDSVLFKAQSNNTQWYYSGLKPYKHYIPIAKDSHDLPSQIEWARNHDKEVHTIAKKSSAFAKENLSEDAIDLYLYLLLTEYAKLQQF